MNNQVTAYPAEYSQEIAVLRKQLAISLKFHHTGTLKKLPVEIAVHVMAEVWDACNGKTDARSAGTTAGGKS